MLLNAAFVCLKLGYFDEALLRLTEALRTA